MLEDRMTAVADKLEQVGYQGIDASPEISLFEYRFLARDDGNGSYSLAIYTGSPYDHPSADDNVYAFTMIDIEDLDDVVEMMHGKAIAKMTGMTLDEWQRLPVVNRISDVDAYIGFVVDLALGARWKYSLIELEQGIPENYF